MMKSLYKEIGTEIPENLEQIKEEFIKEIVAKRWTASIEQYKIRYLSYYDNLPDYRQLNYLKKIGIRFTYHSNKIEGSTLTLREVDLAVNEPNVPINKPTNDIVEAKLHNEIYGDIINKKYDSDLSLDMVLDWHSRLFSLHPNRNNLAGLIRKDRILISGSNFVPPIVCEPLLEDLFNWYKINKDTMYPVLLACLMHFEFVSIHPFNDGNGRISRLLMNYILHKSKYPIYTLPVDIRISYYNALERANLKEDRMFFVGWFFRNFIKYLKSLVLN